jgi:hypothetical protein
MIDSRIEIIIYITNYDFISQMKLDIFSQTRNFQFT